jgi:hypothetical protein
VGEQYPWLWAQRPPLGLLAMPTNSRSGALVRLMTATAVATPPGHVALLGYVAGAPSTSSWALISPFISPSLAACVVHDEMHTHVYVTNGDIVILD